jgi:class 3 adenylate cyclase
MELHIEYARTTDGVNIAYAVMGQGPAIVVPSNAFGDVNVHAHGAYGWFDQLVASGRLVVIYDSRGTGSSDRDVVDSPEGRVLDLEAVVDRIGLERFALVGRVHGGGAAVAYTARHPNKVLRLVLWDAYVRGKDYYTASAYTRAVQALAGASEEDWEFVTLTIGHWSTGFRDAARSRTVAEAFKAGISGQQYLLAIAANERVDVAALLPGISVPTLVIRDPSNVLSDPNAPKIFASTIPSARLLTVRGTEEATQAIIDFTAATSEPTAGPQSGTPGGLRTVLFTDIVGHTDMMQRLGDAKGRVVLREHERITRDLLKQHGGAEVKTMGDGFMASFGSVTSALDCAIALQRAFSARDAVGAQPVAPAAVEPLHVRVGLNAGEPIEEDGDLFGATVILASRIAAKAGAGEILIPEPVRHLLSGKSYVYTDRGEHEMKGFDDAVRLYEVRWRE